ncbi:MAG: hypothetical protein COA79_24635 [Planctomycetota bacterium]|nr:MAG: hypothetical protein COA79_24635 [Planctomycetota bacterium]
MSLKDCIKFLNKIKLIFILSIVFYANQTLLADALEEFKVKREEIYEFVVAPKISGSGDKIKINFTTKGYCDVTIAIEDEQGKILRHLASGVLGKNAPKPFQKNSKKQSVIWNGKDDQARYLENRNRLSIRVSLGINPVFEKNLFWSPYKRISQVCPRIESSKEGVFVYEGAGIDTIKQYDHSGKYLKTVHPFAAGTYKNIKGLRMKKFPQGETRALKQSMYQQTLLTSGNNASINDQMGRKGWAATTMSVRGKSIALAYLKLNRLATDGTTGGLNLEGGKASATFKFRARQNKFNIVGATSSAISPDKKWVYLTGFAYRYKYNSDCMHGVLRMPYAGEGDAKIFVGKISAENGRAAGSGTNPGEFKNASSVACDSKGRVYVSDYANDRIQVFTPEGKFLKAIKVFRPAQVRINERNGDIYVFSWVIPSYELMKGAKYTKQPKLTIFKPFDNPTKISEKELPIIGFRDRFKHYIGLTSALNYYGEIDPWGDKVTIWIGLECRNNEATGVHPGDGGTKTSWANSGIKLIQEVKGKYVVIRDFGKIAKKAIVRCAPAYNALQRLYVNPVSGKLYIGEPDSGPTGKSSKWWVEVDPETEKINVIPLPFNAMEGAFDLNGYVYLRNTNRIVRYDINTWKEIPFDYGVETKAIGDSINGKYAPSISAISLPAKSPVCFHQGGISISPKGNIIASCAYRFVGISQGHYKSKGKKVVPSQSYNPTQYGGRISGATVPCIHVWDKHGKMIYADVAPGVAQIDGVHMDKNDNIYFMHTPTRKMADNKSYFDYMSETLTKIKPGKVKFISSSKKAPIPLASGAQPKRNQDIKGMWVDNAEWFYGGVGYAGFSEPRAGGGCACWFSRFSLDLYARSIVPEPYYYSVSIVDSNGNLITRLGVPGNVDSSGKKSKVPLPGDGLSLFYACYTATHTDKRIFISDHGNGRIVSMKIKYHKSVTNKL